MKLHKKILTSLFILSFLYVHNVAYAENDIENNKIIRRINTASERLDTAILRMEKLLERTNSRALKLENMGINVSETKNFIKKAEDSINDAKGSFEEAKNKTDEQFLSDNDNEDQKITPDEFNKILNPILKQVEYSLKESKTYLAKAVFEMKKSTSKTQE